MEEIRTDRMWNGMLVDEYTNPTNGQIELRSPGASFFGIKGDLLAISNGKNWKLQDSQGFLRRYNQTQVAQNLPTLSEKEFQKKFFTEGTKLFNNDRANILNTHSSEDNRRMFVVKEIPGVIDPTTGREVNSKAKPTTEPIRDEQPEANDEAETPLGDSDSQSTADSDGTETANDEAADGEAGQAAGRAQNAAASVRTLRYPEADLSSFGYDYISFTAHAYKAGKGGSVESLIGGDADRMGLAQGSVHLPMQPALGEAQGVDWGGDRLNKIQAVAAGLAMHAMDDVLAGGPGKAASNFMNDAMAAIKKEATPETMYALKAYFAGQAVGANVFTRATGQVMNPNLELLFNGPMLRQFNFNFTLTPRNSTESIICRDIIKFFKTHMAPQKSPTEMFLYTPNIFKLAYMTSEGGEHPFMNRFKMCALSSFNASYTPQNTYMTYQNKSMTQYSMQLQFSEISPIYYQDQLTAGGTGF